VHVAALGAGAIGTSVAYYLARTGHGTLGWTMAAGTDRLLADLVSGRNPELDLNGLTLARYERR
jgi:D-amino-acid dehydrogenase